MKCADCKEETEELHYNLCEDCFAEFQANDLEYKIEKAMYLHDEMRGK